MLPTIVFILVIYGLYVLMAAWCRRKHLGIRGRVVKERPRWLALSYGAVGLSICFGVLWWLKPAPEDHKLRLAGMLGLGDSLTWTEPRTHSTPEPLPLPAPSPKAQPMYALLHPESQPSLQAPVSPPSGIMPLGQTTGPRRLLVEGKKTKMLNKQLKKDKPLIKPKAKKKKNSGPSTKPALTPPAGRG